MTSSLSLSLSFSLSLSLSLFLSSCLWLSLSRLSSVSFSLSGARMVSCRRSLYLSRGLSSATWAAKRKLHNHVAKSSLMGCQAHVLATRLLNAGYVPATYRRRLTDRTNAAKSPSVPRARQRNRTSGGSTARHDPPSPTRALRIATEQKYKHPLAAAARIGGAAATTPAPTIASCSSPDLAGCQALPPHLLHPRTCHGRIQRSAQSGATGRNLKHPLAAACISGHAPSSAKAAQGSSPPAHK